MIVTRDYRTPNVQITMRVSEFRDMVEWLELLSPDDGCTEDWRAWCDELCPSSSGQRPNAEPEREAPINRLLTVAATMASTMRDVLSIVEANPDYPWQGGGLKSQIREDITAYELLGLDVPDVPRGEA